MKVRAWGHCTLRDASFDSEGKVLKPAITYRGSFVVFGQPQKDGANRCHARIAETDLFTKDYPALQDLRRDLGSGNAVFR